MSTGNSVAGGYLVGTDHLAGSFIELLRNSAEVIRLGATILPGLVGNVAIPKQTGSATASWVSEADAVPESELTTGQVTLSPRAIGIYTDMTRRTLLQTSPAIFDTEASNPIMEKARLDRLRADKIELDLEDQRNELIPAEQVAELWAAIVDNIQDRLSCIPAQSAPALASLLTTAEIQAHNSHCLGRAFKL